MKERPIIFTADSVRAILAGTKTQTRRVVKPHPSDNGYVRIAALDGRLAWPVKLDKHRRFRRAKEVECPYGVPGERLWVRETLEVVSNWGTITYAADNERLFDPEDAMVGFPFTDEATAIVERYGDSYFANEAKRVPSIFMPRWASRITLEVTDIRVQRVQEISGRDILDEGIKVPKQGDVYLTNELREAFKGLWDSINAKRGYSWDSNPWVWVITFKRV